MPLLAAAVSPVQQSLLVLVLLGASDLWVYTDAKQRVDADDPVRMQVGPLRIETPEGWVVACVLIWLLAFPCYLAARKHEG